MKKSLFFLFLLAGLATFQACNKNDDDTTNQTEITAAAEDLATTEDLTEQTDMDIDQAIEERGGSNDCPVVTLSAPWGTWPNTITIDYGAGCTRPDGRVLKGQILVVQTDEIRNAGAVRTVTHNNFFVDDVEITGTRIWTNNGTDDTGLFSYTKTADIALLFPDGTSNTWTSTRTTTLVSGGNTTTWLDNVWSSTGSATGTNRNGEPYSATITTPLIKNATCRWISEGVIEFTRNGNVSTLDFGDGDCDRWASLTLPNGNTISIRLRR
jgi:hypothetical protein